MHAITRRAALALPALLLPAAALALPARAAQVDLLLALVVDASGSIDADEIALLRNDPEVGRMTVHFPRLGYDWRSAS